MLVQLHHQFLRHTELVAQRDVDNKSTKEFKEFLEEMKEKHPCPEDAQWMACTETSEHFMTTHKEAN